MLALVARITYKGKMAQKQLGIVAGALAVLTMIVAYGCGSSVAVWTDGEVPFVRSTPEVIDRMLEMARVTSGDVVYDIGSGDGAIIIRAAKKYGVRGVGIEIDQELVAKARQIASREKVEHLVEFRAARRIYRRRITGNRGDALHAAGIQCQAPADSRSSTTSRKQSRIARLSHRGLGAR